MTARITNLTDSHRCAQQVARLNNKRGASSIIEALHASLSSLVTLMHLRIASGAAAEEDIFQRAGRIRQDLVKHEKVGLQFIFSPSNRRSCQKGPDCDVVFYAKQDGIWEGLELPFSPGVPRTKSRVTLADDPDSCPISHLLVAACQVRKINPAG